jgi:hypothetical protein
VTARESETEIERRESENGGEMSRERQRETKRSGEGAEPRSSDRWTREPRELRSSMIGGWGLKSGDGGASAELRGSNPQPVSPENPRPASQTRQIRENPCDPIFPEVRSSMSDGSNGGFRRAVTCVQQPRRRPKGP